MKLLAAAFAFTATTSQANASGIPDGTPSADTALSIKEVYESSDGVLNYKTFQVEAEADGEYYAGFWLLPARHADKSLTTFTVFVNGEKAGAITPTDGNWQYAVLDDDIAIDLLAGDNFISIATTAPEIPEVECVRVADNREGAVISSEAYDSFLADAIAGNDIEVAEQEPAITLAANSRPDFLWDFELRYSFFKKIKFTKGENIFISSSSDKPHIMDVMYCGEYKEVDPFPSFPSDPIPVGISPKGFEVGIEPHPTTKFFYATSEEMQGLNWKNESEKVTGSKSQVATLKITSIPKTGVYLIRIRTKDNSVQGVVDVHVDNDYFFEEIPISRSFRAASMPADGVEYASMTKSDNPTQDNAMIFIHGNGSDKVVGWNDDGPADKIKENDLDRHDAYISQVYKVPTSGISVSSTSSSKPVSKCHVITRMAVSDGQSSSQKKVPEGINTASISRLNMESEGISIPGSVKFGDGLVISSESRIKELYVFDMAGNMLAKRAVDSDRISMPLSSLNIDSVGVYVVTVATDRSKVSGRILVR